MSKRLYVGNIPFKMREPELEQLFSPHGEITSTKVITDRASGRSRGFGFVEMANDQEAETAIQKMNNADVEGRKIVVNEARPVEKSGGQFRNGRSSDSMN